MATATMNAWEMGDPLTLKRRAAEAEAEAEAKRAHSASLPDLAPLHSKEPGTGAGQLRAVLALRRAARVASRASELYGALPGGGAADGSRLRPTQSWSPERPKTAPGGVRIGGGAEFGAGEQLDPSTKAQRESGPMRGVGCW